MLLLAALRLNPLRERILGPAVVACVSLAMCLSVMVLVEPFRSSRQGDMFFDQAPFLGRRMVLLRFSVVGANHRPFLGRFLLLGKGRQERRGPPESFFL